MHIEPTLPERLSSAVEQLVSGLREQASEERLTRAWNAALSRLDVQGPLGITRLARAEGVSQPAMTQLVDRMVAEGLAERTVSDADRRVVLVRITDAGRVALGERRERRAARLQEHLDALGDADRDALLAAIPALERLAVVTRTRAADESEKREERS
ncbi:MarR family winged helix-turn-helix transcriptional regulator [Microbacterium sp. gxy059]|uniref:MarR family winged helix-turn-helix transcriptional regulator n=1 Tax=Microbacterium sp. gxy059 TaxID=2957199 RepID=UPI003D95F16C